MSGRAEGDEALERRRAKARAQAAARPGPELQEAEDPDPQDALERSRLAVAAPAILLVAISLTLATLAVLRPDPASDRVAAGAEQTALVSAPAGVSEPAVDQPRRALEAAVPAREAIREAERWARTRGDQVSFAVVDSEGELTGTGVDRRYISASIVKSMLLVAELRRLDAAGEPVDPVTRGLLTAMITYSDNEAADTIYARVGDEGLAEVGELYGMERLDLNGYWASTYLTAADMARMFADLEGPIPSEDRELALGMLGSIIPDQSWGIPAAAAGSPEDWQTRFKGGWRTTESGQLAHQAAELRDGDEKLAIAVMTDGQPSFEYATDTVEGIAARLLAEPASAAKPRRDGGRDAQR